MFWCCCGEQPLVYGVGRESLVSRAFDDGAGGYFAWGHSRVFQAGAGWELYQPPLSNLNVPENQRNALTFLGHDYFQPSSPLAIPTHNFYMMHGSQSIGVTRNTMIASASFRLRQNATQVPLTIAIPLSLHIATVPRVPAVGASPIPFSPGNPPSDSLSTTYSTAFGPFAAPIKATLSGSSLDIDCTSQVQALINHATWVSGASFFWLLRTEITASRWITNALLPPGRDDSAWVGGPDFAGDDTNAIAVML